MGEPTQPSSDWRINVAAGLIVFGGVTLFALFFGPQIAANKAATQLKECEQRIQNIADAANKYAADNGGHFPVRLADLVPKYLPELPKCRPRASDTYFNYQVSTQPDAFSFSCCGTVHAQALAKVPGDTTNLPAFHSRRGMIRTPADREKAAQPTPASPP